MIDWLQEWYQLQCNGEWEHENGIKISSLDNPGWLVTIDLAGTLLENVEIPYELHQISETDWYGFSITNNEYKAAGSPNQLSNLIQIFKDILMKYN